MANLGSKWRSASRTVATILTWLGLIASALPLIVPLARPLGSRAAPLIALVRTHGQIFWLSGLSALTAALLIWVMALHRRFAASFADEFKRPINLNWDFRGAWHVGSDNTLVVTGSPDGGLTKVGSLWENYSFSFQAKILQTCVGVVVRARDLDNYYMFQVTQNRIIPHRRVALPVHVQPPVAAETQASTPAQPSSMQVVPVPYVVVWQVMQDIAVSLPQPLTTWFDVNVVVHGEAVRIEIDGAPVFEQQALLQNATGKVGFRNDGSESAMIRHVRVQIAT